MKIALRLPAAQRRQCLASASSARAAYVCAGHLDSLPSLARSLAPCLPPSPASEFNCALLCDSRPGGGSVDFQLPSGSVSEPCAGTDDESNTRAACVTKVCGRGLTHLQTAALSDRLATAKPTVGTPPRFDVEAARADAARSGAPWGGGDRRELPSHADVHVASADTMESHLVGPGQSYWRVPFNVRGQSPLVAHVLQSSHLAAGRARRSREQTRTRSARRRKSKTTDEASEGTQVAWRSPVRHPGA
ncbi:unnamed protein product [Lampetra fluviatilis]